jgi:lysozyme
MLTPQMITKLEQSWIKHEQCRNFPSTAHLGKDPDIGFFYNKLYEDFEWFRILDNERQLVLIDMCKMGYQNFLSFKRMIKAISLGNYDDAAQEMLDSKWAQTDKIRAQELAKAMALGVYE